jgi:hypothetical protein
MPAFGNQRPERLRDLQSTQILFVVNRAADQFEAHRIDLAGRRLDGALDLVERERVIGTLVPIALAVDGMKVKSHAFGGRLPVVAFRTSDALHRSA